MDNIMNGWMAQAYIFTCCDESGYPTSAEAWGVLVTPPPPGGGQLLTSCCAFAVCACYQVTSCVLLKVRVYLLVLLGLE
jgi:hypothetical protein